MNIRKILFTALLCVVSQVMMAQAKRISGSVTDNDGPVMMANVVERDANNRIVSAVQTDFNGNFSMQIKNPKNKLVISYVGDKTKVLAIGNNTTFKVRLEPASTTLKEVTIKSQRRVNQGGLFIPKKELSVAQQTMNMEQVEGLSFTSADEALQGEIAGLDIVSNSGNLGSGTTMRLRGVTTINGNANPLIVVDERVFDNPDEDFDFQNANEEEYASLLSVNVEDIASITVLKDAAATALWGSQGSNGVIKITTKRGSRGRTRVNFNYKFTGTWQPDGYTLLNGDDYTMLMKEEFYNPAQKPDATTDIAELNYTNSWGEFENWNNNTDWVDAVKQFGQMHSYNINLTGGGEKATFRISAGYDHQTGSIIEQKLDRLSTRLALDYYVSDRIKFTTNFALTYTDNNQNYSGLLGIAQQLAPNMSIYRQDRYGNDTGEYYIMNPTAQSGESPYSAPVSSKSMENVRGLGNPVAIAELAWKKDQTYRIKPDFNLRYDLLGTDDEHHRLTLEGGVDFDIFSHSIPSYLPAELSTDPISAKKYNYYRNEESNRFQIGARGQLTFVPHFKNEDISMMMLAKYEMHTSKSNNQTLAQTKLPNGITTGSGAFDTDQTVLSSGNGRSADQYYIMQMHASYKEKYILGLSLRADGNSKFGPKNKWAYFPGVSARYNLGDENFMKFMKPYVSMVGLRASWGISGKAPSKDNLFYNTYSANKGYYGNNGDFVQYAVLDGLKLDDLRWEKTTGLNLGFNLGFLDDIIEIEFDYYDKSTKDLLMTGVGIPNANGYSSLAYANVGEMRNRGWEMNFNARRFLKWGKFSVDASFNIAQNQNEIVEMDERVLNSINSDWVAGDRGTYLNRVQVGNPLGSIYGFRYKGVYQYSYEYLQNYRDEHKLSDVEYENWINSQLAEGKTFPVAVAGNGNVIMKGNSPVRMVYANNSETGDALYKFQGGDLMYEDINKDGQINALDIVYLGNSLPKVSGGFNFTFRYGNFNIKTRFMYRFGNKVVNKARMKLENMYGTVNQSATVNYRWRKDGDITPMPRAMYNTGYNWQGSDRYVEDGSFVRFQNLQVSYNFPKKQIKKWGLENLQIYASMNNLYCWTKYSGVDPEVSTGGWGVATDDSQTPRSKSFTATLSVGF